MATRKATNWFFVFGFEKSEKSNVSPTELEALQALAIELLALTEQQLDCALEDGGA